MSDNEYRNPCDDFLNSLTQIQTAPPHQQQFSNTPVSTSRSQSPSRLGIDSPFTLPPISNASPSWAGNIGPFNTSGSESITNSGSLLSSYALTVDQSASSTTHLRNLATTLIKHYQLLPRMKPVLDEFAAANTIQEQLLYLFCAMVSSNKAARSEQWRISNGLKANITKYSQAMVLSPTLKSFRSNCDTAVLELSIAGLPDENNADHVQQVLSEINKEMITFRSTVKTLIVSSTEAGSNLENIAELSAELVKNTQIPLTLQLYKRVAFLRWFVQQYPLILKGNASEWWIKVDEALQKIREKQDTEANISAAFHQIYLNDTSKPGRDPTVTKHVTVAPTAVPAWYRTVMKNARNVVLQKTTRSGGKKRKRALD